MATYPRPSEPARAWPPAARAAATRAGRARRSARRWLLLVLVGLAMPAAGGCFRLTLISSYDEQLDLGATQLQKRLDAFLTHLERTAGAPEATYERNQPFYDDYGVELRALRLRAAAIPKNDLTVRQLDLMALSVEQLRAAHESGPIAAEATRTFRELFAQGWGAVLALELAKKRGG